MKESTLLKVSIVISLIGIAGLAVFSQISGPPNTEILQIDSQSIGKIVQVSGFIADMSTSKDGHTFIDLADKTGSIDVVAFKSSKIDFTGISRGSDVLVKGKVSEYQGKLEIIASEISAS